MKKKTLLIGILVVSVIFVIAGIAIFNKDKQSNNTIRGERNVVENLYPEKSITHGHGLAVDRADPNKLYIATHHGLLVLLNEKDLYRVGKKQDDYMGFTPHPTLPNVFFSSGHPSYGGNLGFQKSEDGGITWKKVSNGENGPVDFHALTISPVNPDLLYGWYQGNIQRSIDQGNTWEIVNRNVFAVYVAADSQDENTVYAATPQGQGVMVSRDQGVTWTSVSLALEGGGVSVIAVHPKDNRLLLTFSETLGGMGKSIDGGKNWQKIDERFNGETILHVAFDKNNSGKVYALTHENALYRSMDSGATWVKVQ